MHISNKCILLYLISFPISESIVFIFVLFPVIYDRCRDMKYIIKTFFFSNSMVLNWLPNIETIFLGLDNADTYIVTIDYWQAIKASRKGKLSQIYQDLVGTEGESEVSYVWQNYIWFCNLKCSTLSWEKEHLRGTSLNVTT